jgi:hypothetical protein
MEANKALEVLQYIRGAYNRFEINEYMPKVYAEFLKDEPFDKVMIRLKKHIKTSKYEPTISELLASRDELDKETRTIEIARNKWIDNGGDPSEFKY